MSDNNPFEPIERTPFQSHPPQNVHGWERIGSLAGGVLMMGKGLRRGGVIVVLNAGRRPVPLPAGEVLISSSPVGDQLPPDTAVWLRG